MDEFLVCSDLCEENGLGQAAKVLRSVSASGGKAFVVVERGWEYNDEIDEPEAHGHARSIYLDREEAELEASLRNIRVLREHSIRDFCYSLDQVTKLSAQELSAAISSIMGRELLIQGDAEVDSADPDHGRSTIPEQANVAQARAIADLFTLKFAYVVETELA